MAASKKTNVILFDINIGGTVVEEVLRENLKKDPETFSVDEISSVDEAMQFIDMVESAIIMFVVHDQPTLLKSVDLLKRLKNLIKKSHVKVCGFNDLNNPKVDLVLKKSGVTDLLDAGINKKTFQYKLNFWAKSLKPKAVKGSAVENNKDLFDTKGKAKGAAGAKEEAAKKDKAAIRFGKPLDLEEDSWLLKSKEECKLVLNKWLIRLLGPGPAIGKWEQVQDKNNPGSQVWKFINRKQNDESGLFFLPGGAWFFIGQKPEFEWKINRWIFTGPNPTLVYHKGDQQFFRFIVSETGMDIPENSVFALTKEESIIKTIDQEVDFNADEEKLADDPEIAVEKDGTKKGGVSKFAKEDDGKSSDLALENKKKGFGSQGGADSKGTNSGPLVEDDGEGKKSSFAKKDAGEAKESWDGALAGKGKTEKKDDNLRGEGQGKLGSLVDDDDSADGKKKSSFAAKPEGGNLSGKLKGTDNKDGNLRGDNQEGLGSLVDDEEADPNKKKTSFGKLEGGSLSGKLKGTEKQSGGLEGDNKEKLGKLAFGDEDDTDEEKKSSMANDGKQDGHWSGKQKKGTEQAGNYKGSNEEKLGSLVDDEESATDKSTKANFSDAAGMDPLSGKNQTDKLKQENLRGKLGLGLKAPGQGAKKKSNLGLDLEGGDEDAQNSNPVGTDHLKQENLKGKLKKSGESLENLNGENTFKPLFDEDGEGDDSLSGDIKTERKKSDPLKGKIGQAATSFKDIEDRARQAKMDAEKEAGNLQGKGQTEHKKINPLKGRLGTDRIQNKPLEGKMGQDDLSRFDPLEGKTGLKGRDQEQSDYDALADQKAANALGVDLNELTPTEEENKRNQEEEQDGGSLEYQKKKKKNAGDLKYDSEDDQAKGKAGKANQKGRENEAGDAIYGNGKIGKVGGSGDNPFGEGERAAAMDVDPSSLNEEERAAIYGNGEIGPLGGGGNSPFGEEAAVKNNISPEELAKMTPEQKAAIYGNGKIGPLGAGGANSPFGEGANAKKMPTPEEFSQMTPEQRAAIYGNGKIGPLGGGGANSPFAQAQEAAAKNKISPEELAKMTPEQKAAIYGNGKIGPLGGGGANSPFAQAQMQEAAAKNKITPEELAKMTPEQRAAIYGNGEIGPLGASGSGAFADNSAKKKGFGVAKAKESLSSKDSDENPSNEKDASYSFINWDKQSKDGQKPPPNLSPEQQKEWAKNAKVDPLAATANNPFGRKEEDGTKEEKKKTFKGKLANFQIKEGEAKYKATAKNEISEGRGAEHIEYESEEDVRLAANGSTSQGFDYSKNKKGPGQQSLDESQELKEGKSSSSGANLSIASGNSLSKEDAEAKKYKGQFKPSLEVLDGGVGEEGASENEKNEEDVYVADEIELSDLLNQAISDINLESGEMRVTLSLLSERGEKQDLMIKTFLDDLYEKNLTLKTGVDIVGVQIGEKMAIDLVFLYEKSELALQLEGKVSSIDEFEEENGTGHYIHFNLTRIDEKEAENFMKKYNGRQVNITKFMKASKGYDY